MRQIWGAAGSVEVNGARLEAGGGAALSDEPVISLKRTGGGEVLLFDLA